MRALIKVSAVLSLTLFSVLLGGVSTAQTSSPCIDGVDNDGDGLSDINDPGCSFPLAKDGSEGEAWDSDASSLLGGPNGPTKFIPGRAYYGVSSTVSDSGFLEETYVQNPGNDDSRGYGGGTVTTQTITGQPDWDVVQNGFLGLFGEAEFVDPPRDGDCGDGTDDGETSLDCPTDVGLAEDIGESTSTVSDVLNVYVINEGNSPSDGNNIYAREYGANGHGGDYSEDITDDEGGKIFNTTYQGTPDHYIDSNDRDVLNELNVTTSTEEVWTVKNYNLIKDSSVTNWDTNGTVNSTCVPRDENSRCAVSGTAYVDHEKRTVEDHKLQSDTETYTVSSDWFTVSSNGEGYTKNSRSDSFDIEVDRYIKGGSDEIEYDSIDTDEGRNPGVIDEDYESQSKTVSNGADYNTTITDNWLRDVDVNSTGIVRTLSINGNLHEFDGNGNNVWSNEGNSGTRQTLEVYSSGIYIGGSPLRKYDQDGNLLWSKNDVGVDKATVNSLAETPSGNIAAGLGSAFSNNGSVRMFDTSGNQQWKVVYENLFDYPDRGVYNVDHSAIKDIVYSDTTDEIIAAGDTWVYGLDLNGNKLWHYNESELSGDQGDVNFDHLALDSSGNIYVSQNQGGGDAGITKLDPDGNHEWTISTHGAVWGLVVNTDSNQLYYSNATADGANPYLNSIDLDGNEIGSLETSWPPRLSISPDNDYLSTAHPDPEDVNGDSYIQRWTLDRTPFSSSTVSPSADYSILPSDPVVGDSVGFDASGSSYSGGSIDNYRWDVDGDGSFEETGETVSNTFSSDGEHQVNLEIETSDGLKAWANKTILVVEEGVDIDEEYDVGLSTTYRCVEISAPTAGCEMTTDMSYERNNTINYNDGYNSSSINYSMERISLTSEKIFDTNDAETSKDAENVLFQGDYSNVVFHKSAGGEGYYSINRTNDGIEMSNDRAFGWSNFQLTTTGNHFASERTVFRNYEADGPNGEGDGIVAYREGEGVVGSQTNFGPYFDENDISMSCPNSYTKCIGLVDVSLEPWNDWSSPANPRNGAKYEIVEKASTGEGLSACEIYGRLGGDIQCYYNGTDTPRVYGPPSDQPNQRDTVFEGPSVNNQLAQQYPSLYVSTAGAAPVDVVFAFDDSGSMGDNINEVRRNTRDFMNKLGPTSRAGIFSYADGITDRLDLTSDIGTVESKMSSITASGGFEPEDKAYKYGINEFNWDKSKRNMIITLTDEPITRDSATSKTPFEWADIADNNDIEIYNIARLSSGFKRAARATGGEAYYVEDPYADILDDVANGIANESCVYNGTVQPEGTMKDIGEPLRVTRTQYISFEDNQEGKRSLDKELCADIDGDRVGEWHSIDSVDVNQYLRNNRDVAPPEFSNNTDEQAVFGTGVIEEGIAREDDCLGDCSDHGSPGVYYSPFEEGVYNEDTNPIANLTKNSDLDTSPCKVPVTQQQADQVSGSDQIQDIIRALPGLSSTEEQDAIDCVNRWQQANPVSNTLDLGNEIHSSNVLANRVQVGGGEGHGAQNDQGQELKPGKSLGVLENSRVDPQDDEWALTPNLSYALANDGTPYLNGSCYGTGNKSDRVYANSFATIDGEDGTWVNPDNTKKSVIRGGFSCDMSRNDWGYAVENASTSGINCISGDCSREGDPTARGDEGIIASLPHQLVIEESKFAWDKDSNPGSFNQDDKQQWKNACGDDPNEYLIREHAASYGGEYSPDFSGSSDYYGCADRPTDCVLNGKIYSQGQLADVKDQVGQESGSVDSDDQEICVDIDRTIPGGEWADPDNEDVMRVLIGDGTPENPEYYVRDEEPDRKQPGKVMWHDGTESGIHNQAAREAMISPFNPADSQAGYALEDDCDPRLEACDDTGVNEELVQGNLVYSPFKEGMAEDDSNVFDGKAVRMWVGNANGSASTTHGASNNQQNENVPGRVDLSVTRSGETVNLFDSTIDPLEDTWAIAKEKNATVGPRGTIYRPGKCYGNHVLNQPDLQVSKNEKPVANSYAMSLDVDGDGENYEKGVWVNPDTTPESARSGNITCDLNANDWGYGFNLSNEEDLEIIRGAGNEPGDVREQGYDRDDPHVVLGEDIKFENLAKFKNNSGTSYRCPVEDQCATVEVNVSNQDGLPIDTTVELIPIGDPRGSPPVRTGCDGDTVVEENMGPPPQDGLKVVLPEYGISDRLPGRYGGGEEVERSYTVDDSQDPNLKCSGSGEKFDRYLPPQYGKACGDDRNEYLIREHNSSNPNRYEDEHNPSLTEDNIYVCATDMDACALNGKIYREGELADIQAETPSGTNQEAGVNSIDEEVCVDVDPSVPGGEWVDVDDESINQILKGDHTEDDVDSYESYFVRERSDYSGDGIVWFTDNFAPAEEVEISPYNPLDYSDGYALEDDVGPDVTYTSDGGNEERYFTPQAVYSYFEEGRPEDDRILGGKDGDGTVSNPYEISNCQDVQSMNDDLDAVYELQNDIDCSGTTSWNSGQGFKPIGGSPVGDRSEEAFTGTLLGQEYIIDEVFIDRPSQEFVGLFGNVRNGEVRNLRIDDADITGDDSVGVLAGAFTGSIESVRADGEASGSYFTGGLVGQNDASISESFAAVNVSGGDYYTGGLAGTQRDGTITESFSSGDIVGNNYTGGLVGDNQQALIESSFVCGEVSGSYYVGGLAGKSIDGDFQRSWSSAQVSGSDHTGGWLGNNSGGTDNGVYWDTQASGESTSDGSGTGLSTSEMQDSSASSNMPELAYGSVWETTSSYPDLQWMQDKDYCNGAGVEDVDDGAGDPGTDVFNGRSVQMYVGYANGTAYSSHGSTNGQDRENTDTVTFDASEFGWPTAKLNDSTIDPFEDTWSISAEIENPVGPTGNVWQEGKCYGRNAWNISDDWTTKDEKVVANSYAMGVNVTGYPPSNPHYDTSELEDQEKGVWVNPDSTIDSATVGGYSCDLNATDWGYGYNTGEGDSLNVVQGEARQNGFDPSEPHVVTGDIVFDINSDPGVPDDEVEFIGDDGDGLPGDGTEDSPYRISTCQDLQNMKNDLDANYQLENNIDCSNFNDFSKIGKNSINDWFTGVLDGRGYVVDSLTIKASSDWTGMIGYAYNGAEIRDIGLTNVDISAKDYTNIGGLVGGSLGLNITNSYTTGKIVGTRDSSSFVGGLVGAPSSITKKSAIKSSYSNATVIGYDRVGGLVGNNDVEIINSYSAGKVSGKRSVGGLVGTNDGLINRTYSTANVSGADTIGGLVGNNRGSINSSYSMGNVSGGQPGGLVGANIGLINSTYSIADVYTSSTLAGGLVAQNGGYSSRPNTYSGSIHNSYSAGNLSVDVDGFDKEDFTEDLGGLLGRNYGGRYVDISDNYWDTEATGLNSSDAGTGLTTSEMQGSNSKSNMDFDFKNTWKMTSGYPKLRWTPKEYGLNNDNDNSSLEQRNLQQYPNACGDDQNEFLIREHGSDPNKSEHKPNLTEDNIYACADRPTDCVYNGEIYSMGQVKDVSGKSSGGPSEELGSDSIDAEVCVDTDSDLPGGEWVDADNHTVYEEVIGSGTPEQPDTYDGNPTTTKRGGDVRWYNTSYNASLDYPVAEAYNSPYSNLSWKAGYAFEDDVGPDVQWADDSGATETRIKGEAVYTHWEAGKKVDDRNIADGYVLRMYVNGSAEHGASNDQEDENVFENLPQLNDSTIDPNEDTWAIGSEPYYAVGPTGEIYENGSCYGRFNADTKAGTVVANSFVLAHDVDGDGQKEGDWVNPDYHEEALLKGAGTCTIGTADNWGLGYNNESKTGLEIVRGQSEARSLGYETGPSWESQLVSGPVTFDNRTISGDDPGAMKQDDLPQYPDSCGDDGNEHLIREHSSLTKNLESNKSDEHLPELNRDNIYVCADRVSDCAFNGSVYSEGQLADVSRDREIGNSSKDLEVCIDTDKRIPGGEWHDIDNSTWNQYLKGAPVNYTADRPETYKHLVADNASMTNHWFTDDNPHANEVEISPYNHLNYSDGYALEDDCSEGVEACADIGNNTQHRPGEAIYNSFEEDVGDDDSNVLDGRAVRMYVGYANGTAWASHGKTNNQSEENAGDLNFTVPVPDWHVDAGNSDAPISLNDSTIDPREDTWAIANRTDAVVGPKGEIYMDGKCYGGQPNYSGEGWIIKNETIMANSLAYSMEANADGNNEGVWINPDSTNETLLDGGFSCDLNATDWGIGYDMGPGSDLTAVETSQSNIRDKGYEASDPHAVAGPIQFDSESDPGEKEQRDQAQFPDACGDDQNEYLIREHGSPDSNEYEESLQRDNIYGCADRISDCVYNGEVYSEGQTVDISSAAAPGEDPERGDDIADEEICLDLNSSIPGGEFYDKDNNWTVKQRVKELSPIPEDTWDRVEYFQDEDFGANPGTDWKNRTHLLDRENTSYFNNSGTFNQNYNQHSPTGYATEDDCGPILRRLGTGPCGDVGPSVQNISWFSAGNFSFRPSNPDMQEGTPQDNYDVPLGFRGRHNRIDDDSDQFEPGAATQRNWNLTDVYGADYRIYDTRDSTPGPDKWALTRYLNYSIDNRGNAYRPATANRSGCFYRSNVPVRTDIDDDGVMKTDKVFGNSLAVAEDYDGDSQVEGVWKDPDDTAVKYANFTCDLTGPDKGYGYDTGDDDGNFIYKNNDKSTHVVEGDIAFSSIEGKKGAFEQEPPVCGDDHKEFLLEELGEVVNSQSETGRWGCGTDRDDCVSRSGGEYALYREGDVVNTEEAAESFGRSKFDEEVCMQKSQDKYGVWYDQDYSQDICQVNNLYGSAGVRWLDADYIDTHPHSVTEGINDDLNPYLYNRRSDFNESTQGNVSDYMSNTNDRSPVPTGKWVNRSVDEYYSDTGSFSPTAQYLNLSATKGFCGGDDEGENVVVQQSSTDLIETNFSVIGIADNPDDCVLDGANIDAVSHNIRQLYSPGDEVELDFGQSTRRISCFAGQWFANWPVTFVDRNISIEEETSANIQFKVVNVRNTRTTYEVELDPDSDIEPFTSFTEFEGDTFTTTVPAESTESYSLEVYGEDRSVGPVNITLDAQSLTGDIQGSDNVTVDVVESSDAAGTSQSVDEVPGIGFLQLIMMMILSTLIYYRRLD